MQLKLLVIKRKNRLANGNMNDNYILIKIAQVSLVVIRYFEPYSELILIVSHMWGPSHVEFYVIVTVDCNR